MTKGNVKVEMEGPIALLTFQGRGDLNLLVSDLINDFVRAFEDLESNPAVRTVILTGQGERAFSAGVDVREMKDLSPRKAESFIRSLHSVMRKIMAFPRPVIASIRGPCLGGALELAMACDLRIASEDALFGLPEVRVGIPSVIEASYLPRMIGLGRARELILTGDVIDAQEAYRIGLVNRTVLRENLESETMKTANAFLGLSPLVLGIQKDIIDKWLQLGTEQAAQYSIKAFALCFASSHPREGMEAFLEKREPVF